MLVQVCALERVVNILCCINSAVALGYHKLHPNKPQKYAQPTKFRGKNYEEKY
jgi:hypothetical protein